MNLKFEDKYFPQKTNELLVRLNKGENLNDLLPEAFALVKEASKESTMRDILMFSLSVELPYMKIKLRR